ncbi:hypothetical protein [Aquamicrobium sp.]|uniref:hypothetical protein n=1 Tax=Aquamicrobium sp. TaxID=1872579 RepID=UPI00258C7286|nr:hypothetical protein [Aquamicrobium sp.]MCK9553022.1 hypothetical protein [Aquamicrobium sp.]
MSKSLRSVLREAGAAFALLAIYVLTVLTPLHQSAALQRDFGKLGYETIGALTICTAINESDDADGTPTALKCPVAGIGKTQLTLGSSAPSALELERLVTEVDFIATTDSLPGVHIVHKARPRAPPVLV